MQAAGGTAQRRSDTALITSPGQLIHPAGREVWRYGGRYGGRKGGKKGGREVGREIRKEGGKKGGREVGRYM